MKKLDKFIVKSFVGPFIAILLIVVFILMMQFLWLYIDELVGKGLGLAVILEFMMWGGCTILPLALPLATLLSSMMTLGSMTENTELMAIKASGTSLARVMLPIMVCSLIISVGAFFAGNNLVPKAFNEIFTLRDDINHTKNEIKIPTGTFYDGIEGYVLRVGGQNKETGMLYDVMLYDHTDGKGNVSMTIADSATIRMSKAKDYLIFTLYDGTNYQETNQRTGSDYDLKLQNISFGMQESVISLKNYAFQKSSDNRFGDQIKSQSIKSLNQERDSVTRVIDGTLDRNYKTIAEGWYFSLKEQLDTAKCNLEAPLFEHPQYMKWNSRAAKTAALKAASEKAKRMESDVQGFENECYSEYFYQRRTDVEIKRKFAQALACFILFFVGAPLGALIGKGGLGTSAIVSALFFVLYWVVDISGTKLANNGDVSPSLGAFISSYVLLPIGLFLTYKAVNDSPIINMDSFKTWFRKAKSKFISIFRKTRIVYMGTPEFAVAPLEALLNAGYKVVGVVTVADKPSGRGLKMSESAVKKYAVQKGIPVLQPVKLKDPEFLTRLKALKADMFVVVAFRMLPEEVWAMPRMGTFNLHAALLPQYRGAAPINWAVINGEKMTGVTTFMIDKQIDTGGIILRQESRIAPTDTAGDVHDALMGLGADLVLQTVEGLIEHNVETRVQKSFVQGSEVLKPAPKLTPELQHICWDDTAVQVHNLIRGLSPYPAAYTTLEKDGVQTTLKIYKSSIIDVHAEPGTVLSDGRTFLAVATRDAAVSIEDLQMSGKKRMGVEEFLRGFREPEAWKAVGGTSKEELARLRAVKY